MIDFKYLEKGLLGLSRAHRVNTMSGHLGAAIVAGYFVGEQQPNLDDKVYAGIEKGLERIIKGESVFSPRKNSGITAADLFKPYPKQKPQAKLMDTIANALAGNINKTRQSGHNVIFASIALRAIKDHPEFATPAMIGGIRKLIESFNGKPPGNGYYGKKRGRINGRKIELPEDKNFPQYTSLQAMVKAVIGELIDKAADRRVGYGGLVHIVNHAAALIELSKYGYKKLALKGLPAHHQHVRLWRTLPDVTEEMGAVKPAQHAPTTVKYWQTRLVKRERAMLTHRIKTLYGFYELLPFVEDKALRNKALDKLRYLV